MNRKKYVEESDCTLRSLGTEFALADRHSETPRPQTGQSTSRGRFELRSCQLQARGVPALSHFSDKALLNIL
jgi:hypothetical protein